MSYSEKKCGGFDLLWIKGEQKGGILTFHGYGADAFDLLGLSSIYQDHPTPHWFFPQGPLEIPIMPGRVGRAWYPVDFGALQKPNAKVDDLFPSDLSPLCRDVEKMILALDIPPENLLIGGFSQGALLALEIALRSSHAYSGLFLLSCPFIHEPLLNNLAPRLSGTAFFQSHGQNDPLLPFIGAKKLEALLLNAGLIGKLHAFEGGHEIPHALLYSLNRFFHLRMTSC